MNQIPTLVGHLEWLLTQTHTTPGQSPLAFYNCAIRIRLDALDPARWSHSGGDSVRKTLLTRVDALANAALAMHLTPRTNPRTQANLAKMETRCQAVVDFARKSGFVSAAAEVPEASRPPEVPAVIAALTGLSSEFDKLPAIPAKYTRNIGDGLLDVFAGAAQLRRDDAESRKIGRTMVNTVAATIELAQQAQRSSAVTPALKRHNRLAAKVLRKPL